MKAFLYGVRLQFIMDIRSRTMLVTCYLVPLVFYFFMGGVFTSVMPSAVETLIPSMSVFVIAMSALMGLPPSLGEVYGGGIKKIYKANGVPVCLGVITQFISAFLHTLIVCLIIFATAPAVFGAELPENLPLYFCSLVIYLCVMLALGCVLGLAVGAQAKQTMVAMVIFLPSVILSGIMFPASMLPDILQYISYIFPATIAFSSMTALEVWHLPVLCAVFVVLAGIVALLLFRKSAD